ncbi:hypothetical protein ONV78_20945 [Hahella sp. CR1]|nr:hypothetical protein [Hahella sp. CR1]MDG9670218.1 hypothetical protein [Hahella sp. CR1]
MSTEVVLNLGGIGGDLVKPGQHHQRSEAGIQPPCGICFRHPDYHDN